MLVMPVDIGGLQIPLVFVIAYALMVGNFAFLALGLWLDEKFPAR